jgi:drug/metabolite transporter (DMT)-like permease
MWALLLCVVLNALLFVLFREFGRRGVSLYQAVPVNYVVAAAMCFLFEPELLTDVRDAAPDWRWLGVAQGSLFIGMFLFIGAAVHRTGIAYTTLMTKVSVVVPVTVTVLVFGESFSWIRALGLLAAVAAVVLINWQKLRSAPADSTTSGPSATVLVSIGITLFLGSGLIDTNFKLFDAWYAQMLSGTAFTAVLFSIAAAIGLLYLTWRVVKRSEQLNARHLLPGVLLGIPNYFTVVLLVSGLRELPAVVFFPANNIGQLILGSLAGGVLYRERLDALSWVGVGLASAAIVLLVF